MFRLARANHHPRIKFCNIRFVLLRGFGTSGECVERDRHAEFLRGRPKRIISLLLYGRSSGCAAQMSAPFNPSFAQRSSSRRASWTSNSETSASPASRADRNYRRARADFWTSVAERR
jgi:hypothetical protein